MKIGTTQRITTAAGTTPIPVASDAVVYTPSLPIMGGEAWGVTVLPDSDGDVDVKIELEQGEAPPSTEEAVSADWVEPDGMADILNVTDKVLHKKRVTPIPGMYARFKLTGQGTNDASTTIRIDLFRQEQT